MEEEEVRDLEEVLAEHPSKNRSKFYMNLAKLLASQTKTSKNSSQVNAAAGKYKCESCSFLSDSERTFQKHRAKFHFVQTEEDYMGFCPVRGCKYVAETYNMVRAHLTTDHEKRIKIKTILHEVPATENTETAEVEKKDGCKPKKKIESTKSSASSSNLRPYDFVCDVIGCDYGTYRKYYLMKHLEKHQKTSALLTRVEDSSSNAAAASEAASDPAPMESVTTQRSTRIKKAKKRFRIEEEWEVYSKPKRSKIQEILDDDREFDNVEESPKPKDEGTPEDDDKLKKKVRVRLIPTVITYPKLQQCLIEMAKTHYPEGTPAASPWMSKPDTLVTNMISQHVGMCNICVTNSSLVNQVSLLKGDPESLEAEKPTDLVIKLGERIQNLVSENRNLLSRIQFLESKLVDQTRQEFVEKSVVSDDKGKDTENKELENKKLINRICWLEDSIRKMRQVVSNAESIEGMTAREAYKNLLTGIQKPQLQKLNEYWMIQGYRLIDINILRVALEDAQKCGHTSLVITEVNPSHSKIDLATQMGLLCKRCGFQTIFHTSSFSEESPSNYSINKTFLAALGTKSYMNLCQLIQASTTAIKVNLKSDRSFAKLQKKSKMILSVDRRSYSAELGLDEDPSTSFGTEEVLVTPDLSATYDNIAEDEEKEDDVNLVMNANSKCDKELTAAHEQDPCPPQKVESYFDAKDDSSSMELEHCDLIRSIHEGMSDSPPKQPPNPTENSCEEDINQVLAHAEGPSTSFIQGEKSEDKEIENLSSSGGIKTEVEEANNPETPAKGQQPMLKVKPFEHLMDHNLLKDHTSEPAQTSENLTKYVSEGSGDCEPILVPPGTRLAAKNIEQILTRDTNLAAGVYKIMKNNKEHILIVRNANKGETTKADGGNMGSSILNKTRFVASSSNINPLPAVMKPSFVSQSGVSIAASTSPGTFLSRLSPGLVAPAPGSRLVPGTYMHSKSFLASNAPIQGANPVQGSCGNIKLTTAPITPGVSQGVRLFKQATASNASMGTKGANSLLSASTSQSSNANTLSVARPLSQPIVQSQSQFRPIQSKAFLPLKPKLAPTNMSRAATTSPETGPVTSSYGNRTYISFSFQGESKRSKQGETCEEQMTEATSASAHHQNVVSKAPITSPAILNNQGGKISLETRKTPRRRAVGSFLLPSSSLPEGWSRHAYETKKGADQKVIKVILRPQDKTVTLFNKSDLDSYTTKFNLPPVDPALFEFKYHASHLGGAQASTLSGESTKNVVRSEKVSVSNKPSVTIQKQFKVGESESNAKNVKVSSSEGMKMVKMKVRMAGGGSKTVLVPAVPKKDGGQLILLPRTIQEQKRTPASSSTKVPDQTVEDNSNISKEDLEQTVPNPRLHCDESLGENPEELPTPKETDVENEMDRFDRDLDDLDCLIQKENDAVLENESQLDKEETDEPRLVIDFNSSRDDEINKRNTLGQSEIDVNDLMNKKDQENGNKKQDRATPVSTGEEEKLTQSNQKMINCAGMIIGEDAKEQMNQNKMDKSDELGESSIKTSDIDSLVQEELNTNDMDYDRDSYLDQDPLGETDKDNSNKDPLGETDKDHSDQDPLGETDKDHSNQDPLGDTDEDHSNQDPLGETDEDHSNQDPPDETDEVHSNQDPLGETDKDHSNQDPPGETDQKEDGDQLVEAENIDQITDEVMMEVIPD